MQSARTDRFTWQATTIWGNVPAAQWMHNLRKKKPDIYDHCVRVALLSERLALRMKLPPESRTQLLHGGFLHDLGKLLRPNALLQAGTPITESDKRLWRLHPELGAEILERDGGVDAETLAIVRCHHEHWDGSGYPNGLKGEEIPYLARICAVIEEFDHLLANLPVRSESCLRQVRLELVRQSWRKFDGQIVKELMDLVSDEAHLYVRR